MTDEYIPRKEKKLNISELTPNGATQKKILDKMTIYLMALGVDEKVAEVVALDLWRMTRVVEG
jgi:hypothetical protein